MLIHVTGANGQVGKEVLKAVSPLGKVYGSDVAEMNITDPNIVSEVIRKQKPDVIIHAAALKGNQPSRNNPMDFFSVNTIVTFKLCGKKTDLPHSARDTTGINILTDLERTQKQ